MNAFNNQSIQRLQEANLRNRIAVVGSGLSVLASPSLKQLIATIEKNCGIKKPTDQHSWDFCEHAHNANSDAYFEAIRTSFEKPNPISCRSYDYLSAISFSGFITFNYDDQLPFALRKRLGCNFQKYFAVYPSDNFFPALQMSVPPQRLVAIHGYASRNNPNWPREVILRLSDYNTHYILQGARLRSWWTDLLLGASLIFIGSSLREPGLYRIIEELAEFNIDQLLARRHIHLTPMPEGSNWNDCQTQQFTHKVIEKYYYDPIDKEHTGLLEILMALSGQDLDSLEPRLEAPHPIVLGEVFPFEYHEPRY